MMQKVKWSMKFLTTKFLKENIDANIVDIKLNENYECEYDLKIKDIKFLKRHGVVLPMPTSDCNLENSFFDAVLDALFLKFRGLSINFNVEVLSTLTNFPMPKIVKMLMNRIDDGRLTCYEKKNPKRVYYINPYEKEYW